MNRIFLLILLCFPTLTFAHNRSTPLVEDLISSETVVDFGTRNEQTSVSKWFKISVPLNQKAQKISGIYPGCSCAVIDMPRLPMALEPGEASVPFLCSWRLAGRKGPNDISLKVFNDRDELIRVAKLKCNVLPAISIIPERRKIDSSVLAEDKGLTFTLVAGTLPVKGLSYSIEPPWDKILTINAPVSLDAKTTQVIKMQVRKQLSLEKLPQYGICRIRISGIGEEHFAWTIPTKSSRSETATFDELLNRNKVSKKK